MEDRGLIIMFCQSFYFFSSKCFIACLNRHIIAWLFFSRRPSRAESRIVIPRSGSHFLEVPQPGMRLRSNTGPRPGTTGSVWSLFGYRPNIQWVFSLYRFGNLINFIFKIDGGIKKAYDSFHETRPCLKNYQLSVWLCGLRSGPHQWDHGSFPVVGMFDDMWSADRTGFPPGTPVSFHS